MLNISKSGEEGYYPELQKCAEERLRSLSPNNRQLRTEEPVLSRNSMNSDDWNNTISDLANWKKEISVRDLRLTEENNNTMQEISLPPVRQPPTSKYGLEKKEAKEQGRGKQVNDYATWDRYDADTEMLKMDLEEEKEKEERLRQKRQVEMDRLELVVKEAEKLSETERQVLAEEEKNRGNEYYEAKEYKEAIKYYTASIAMWPTAKAHNNRAACYLKQCKYSEALNDTNITLELEPDNIKALFRRGISLQHKNMFREALADMTAVLKCQPKNVLAQQIAKDLREQILTLPRTVRIMTDVGFNKPKKIREVNVEDLTNNGLGGNSFEVNEFGLPKVMCQCNSSSRFLQLAPRRCPTPHLQPHLPASLSDPARIVELTDSTETKSSTKLEIIEVEKSEAVDDFFKPVKCVVVDKRTQKNMLTNSDISTKLDKEDSILNLANDVPSFSNGDASMDSDFELTCPLLEDPKEPVPEPSV